MSITLEDKRGHYVMFDVLEGGHIHLYYDCGPGNKFELVGKAEKLLHHLRFALNSLDHLTVEPR